MDVGEVRIAEDKDFDLLKVYLSRNDGWALDFEMGRTVVWTREPPLDKGGDVNFKMIRVNAESKAAGPEWNVVLNPP